MAVDCQVMGDEMAKAQSEASTYINSTDTPELTKIFIMSSTVQFYALQTLVYRIIPAPGLSTSRFCDESLQSARNAMEHHLNGVHLLGSKTHMQTTYVHW